MSEEKKLVRNRAKCRKCKDIIESKTRHDFVWCGCKAIFVDGGLAYRRCGGDLNLIEDLCEYED